MIKLCISLLLLIGMVNAQRSVAELFGKKFYVQTNKNEIDKSNLISIDTLGNKIFKVKGISAICAAILVEANYRIYCKTQYKWVLPTNAQVGNSDVNTNIWVSETFMDQITGTEISKNDKDIKIKLKFYNGGATEYNGKDILQKTANNIIYNDSDLKTNFTSNFNVTEYIKRPIYQVFLQLPEEESIKKVVSVIEKEMDKLKLDLTYTFPEFEKESK